MCPSVGVRVDGGRCRLAQFTRSARGAIIEAFIDTPQRIDGKLWRKVHMLVTNAPGRLSALGQALSREGAHIETYDRDDTAGTWQADILLPVHEMEDDVLSELQNVFHQVRPLPVRIHEGHVEVECSLAAADADRAVQRARITLRAHANSIQTDPK